MSLRTGLVAVACAVAAACASAKPEASSLAGTRWKGVVEPSTAAGMIPWLDFTADRLSGFTGCNQLSGTWRDEGGEIRLGALAATKRGCLGPASDLERRVLAAMSERARVSREGAKLVFTGPGGERFEFVAR